MFGDLGNLKELGKLMGNAGALRQQYEAMQEALAKKTVEGDAGAGAVRVRVSGTLEVQSVQIDPAMLASFVGSGSAADRQMVEDLVAAATNDGLERAQALAREEIQKLAGGLQIPGLGGA